MLVIVTGPPASGKTTLAQALSRELELPLLAKDPIKETLYNALGTGDRPWSRRLGAASYDVLFSVAGELLRTGLSLVVEANFTRGKSAAGFVGLPEHRLVQIVCTADEDTLLARYRVRAQRGQRHEGHLDVELEDEVVAAIRTERHGALNLPGALILNRHDRTGRCDRSRCPDP